MRGSFSSTLVKMVVITSMFVRLTAKAASKKVVAKVINMRRVEGKKVAIISLKILLLRTIIIVTPFSGALSFRNASSQRSMVNRVISLSCSIQSFLGKSLKVGLSRFEVAMSMEQVCLSKG